MTTTKEAHALARKFASEHPDLTGRTVRLAMIGAPCDLYIRSLGPRGGLGKRQRVASLSRGMTTIVHVESGDVATFEYEGAFGPDRYESFVVAPHHEDSYRAHESWRPEFSYSEKLASARWAAQHGNVGRDEGAALDDLIPFLEMAIEEVDEARE